MVFVCSMAVNGRISKCRATSNVLNYCDDATFNADFVKYASHPHPTNLVLPHLFEFYHFPANPLSCCAFASNSCSSNLCSQGFHKP